MDSETITLRRSERGSGRDQLRDILSGGMVGGAHVVLNEALRISAHPHKVGMRHICASPFWGIVN